MRRICPWHAGFTLVELILVMVIMMIAMAMAVPSLRTFGRGREAGFAAEQIVALTQWARTQAITRGVTYRLNLDPVARKYWLTGNEGGTVDTLGEEFGREFDLPEGLSIEWDVQPQPDGQYISFYPTGRTDPATIRLTDRAGLVTTVACQSPTELFRILTPQEVQGQ